MKNPITFTKMHGLGNDYIYVNCLEFTLSNPEELAIKLSDRHFGIGADGLVLILPSETCDFRMRMFNADGSEAEMCGNAVRCIAKYVFEKQLTNKTEISLETLAGIKILKLHLDHNTVKEITVDMGEPNFKTSEIPVLSKNQEVLNEILSINDINLKFSCVSVGNPHAVIFVDKITDMHVLELGPKIETLKIFPKRINVEFVEVISPEEVNMRVWERGSGETLACGTGAVAVVAIGVKIGLLSKDVTVNLLGGKLKIKLADNNHLFKTGPATFVFEGTICI